MNQLNDIFDNEFVPFLHTLGVDTYKKSFEWMLSDPHFAGVLRWLYNNLDQNNALNPRENCRYIELEKNDNLLTPKELEASITSIQDQYPGICLPGDHEAIEDVKLDIQLLQEMLGHMERQEQAVDDLITQNESTKENLSLEVTQLHAAQSQSADDEKAAAEECTRLAGDVEKVTNDVMDVVANALDVYSSCHTDKENAKKFFTFGPLEAYRQSQALFMSHYDLYTAKRFHVWQNSFSEEELRSTLYAAKCSEEHLTTAIREYIESKAELCGERAKLSLVANFNNIHPSHVEACLLEDQSTVELLEQEECILEQQIQNAIKQLVDERTSLTVETLVKSRLAVREQIHSDLTHLVSTTQQAATLDKLVYCALRHELCSVARLLHFAAELRQHIVDEGDAVSSRIDAMNEIRAEQEFCERKLESSDNLLQTLNSIFGVVPSSDGLVLIKHHTDLQNTLKELNDNISEGFKRKEDSLVALKKSSKPLQEYIYDGCTKQPNCWDRTLSSMMHALRQEIDITNKKVVEASDQFTSVKNGDKQQLRKLWQWFLTDETKLRSAIKGGQISYK